MSRYPLIVALAVSACAKRPIEPSGAEPGPTAEVKLPRALAEEAAAEVLIRARPACDGWIRVPLAGACTEWVLGNRLRGAPEQPAPVGAVPAGLQCRPFGNLGFHWTVWVEPGATGTIQCAVSGCISPLFRITEDVTSTDTLVVGAYRRPVTETWTQRWDVPHAKAEEVEGPGGIVGATLPRRAMPCPE